MFKAFDTVDKKKLIDILRKTDTEVKNVSKIKRSLNQTALRAKPDMGTVQHQQRGPKKGWTSI